MLSFWRPAVVTAMLLAATACTTALSVGSYGERALDIRSHRRYGWGAPDPLPVSDPRLAHDPAFQDRLQGAIDKALAAKGLCLSDAPDFLIHVHAASLRRLAVAPAGTRIGACVDEPCEARVVAHDVAILVLDVVDARTDRLLWRGWAEADIDRLIEGGARAARDLTDAASRMIAELPVASPGPQER